ncbi:MAG TPA: MaoC/PaaZ C-terminal domain-containing protein [Candidatus Binataceae bacterium]|nr:MaoC/PaaZ C-terminal domain-containing protein [Candidatus Binataceae bacterium]
MPFDSSLVGTKLGPFDFEVDAGWTMAYAAGLGDMSPAYVDSLGTGALVAHPMFPVCFVWNGLAELDRRLRDSPLARDEAVRRVHATQDMILHRALRPPEKVTMRATLIGAERRKPGTYIVTRYETTDATGAPVSTVYWGQIYRNVELVGGDRPTTEIPLAPQVGQWDGHPRGEFAIPIPAALAHVYSACARQMNAVNIHTDTAIAKRAGLPGPILMGTATLALSVSKIVTAEAGGDPARVASVHARFGAMVLMPSEVLLRITKREKRDGDDVIFFETLSAESGSAIRDGVVVLRG